MHGALEPHVFFEEYMTDESIKNESIKNDKRIFTMNQENPYKAVSKMGIPLIAGMML